MLVKELEERRRKLRGYIRRCESWLKKAPEGRLQVSRIKGKARFYQRTGKSTGKYLSRKNDTELLRKLALKTYCEKIIAEARDELRRIEHLLELEKLEPVARIYPELSEDIRLLIDKRIEDTLDMENREWLKEKYVHMGDIVGSSQIQTLRGDCVRSRAEYCIANELFDLGVPYRYEYPVKVPNGDTLWPDFTIRNPNTGKVMYWEHLGMIDNDKYRNRLFEKLAEYREIGVFPGHGLIITMEDKDHHISVKEVQTIIRKFMED